MLTQMTRRSETNDLASSSTIEVRGRVIRSFLTKKRLSIEVLLLSGDSVPIEAFKVEFRGQKFYAKPISLKDSKLQHFVLHLPLKNSHSANIKPSKGYVKEPYSQKILAFLRQGLAYFLPNLFTKLYRRTIRKENVLLSVTPVSKGKEGSSFYSLVHLKLPLPIERENRKIGGGNLVNISSEFLSLMVEQGGLKKTDHLLDVGCGLGRMAYALAYYLEPHARYEGFDIMPSLIARAKKFISPYFPNFQFKHVNVWNSFYNPQGTEKSSSFRFPYDDQSFHFVLLTSVFSHMLTADIQHYLSEIYRVLKPGGRSLFSCFLLTEESKKFIQAGKSTQKLVHPFGDHCYVVSPEYPEASIGYEKSAMLDLVTQGGFKVQNICKGSWSGREDYVSYQDIMIISK